MIPEVKICGLAREADVASAVETGPDALGFVFWERSPRAVTPAQVAEWTRDVPDSILKVGVFVNADLDTVRRTVDEAGLDVVQLHGDESFEFIEALSVRTWKALHLDRLPETWSRLPVEAVLLDSGTRESPGGTGVRVDRDRAADFVRESPVPVLLAGGLKAGMVGDSIRAVRPAGVDVSSGVELRPGVKDPSAVRDFVLEARDAFNSIQTHD